MLDDIFIVMLDFHNSIIATSTNNADGSYTIFINSRATREQQKAGYLHELHHILQLDFESKTESIDLIEHYAHCKF